MTTPALFFLLSLALQDRTGKDWPHLRGPELDGIAWRRSREFLRESIVDPNADVDPKWWSAMVTDQSGNVHIGQLLDEDTYSIRLLDEQDELRSLLKSEIEGREILRLSTMIIPEVLSPDEVDDLVAYLETLRGEQ